MAAVVAAARVTTGATVVAFGHCGTWADAIRLNLDGRYAPSFVDLAEVRLQDFDAVIPMQIEQYAALARQPELRGVKFFHPSADVVGLCHDKLELTEFLAAEGFSSVVPSLRPSGPPYPYVWKRRSGYWGAHCQIVNGPQDEAALDLGDDAAFAQALVPGEVECATHILRVGGRIRYASTFSHEMAGPSLVLGEQQRPLRTRFERGCPHLHLFSQILERLAYEGTTCFDYKVNDGQPMLFEINPRYGGSLSGDVTAYLDAYLGALTALPTGCGDAAGAGCA